MSADRDTLITAIAADILHTQGAVRGGLIHRHDVAAMLDACDRLGYRVVGPAERCSTCAHFDADSIKVNAPDYGECKLAEGPGDKTTAMEADGNDGYSSWLYVRPDHYCAAWTALREDEIP